MDILLFIIAFLDFVAGRKVRSMYIAIFLTTNAFETVKSMSFPVQHEMGDLGLLLMILMWTLYPRIYGRSIPRFALINALIVFALFLGVSILVDMIYNSNSLGGIILTNRRFWLFIAAYSLCILNKEEINVLLKAIILTNMAVLFISFLQYLGLVHVFTYNFDHFKGKDFLGFYAPLSLMPATLLLLSQKGKEYIPNYRNLLLTLCIVAVLLTVVRSYIISFGVAAILVVFLFQKIDYTKMAYALGMLLLVAVVFSFVPQLLNRFSEADHAMKSGSMAFRAGLIDAAFKYVGSNLKNIIFGLGWEYLDFNHASGWNIRQWILSTPDTSWPPLLGRLGYLGTIIFLSIYIALIKTAIQLRNSLIAPILLGLVIHLLLISFAGSSLIHGKFILIPYLLYFYMQHEKEELTDTE